MATAQTCSAQSQGELNYALRFAEAHPDIFTIGDPTSRRDET